MSNDLTSTTDLFTFGKLYNLQINDIVTKDKLPNDLKDGGYIINLQNSDDGNGTHWVCIYVRNKEMCYFDSFGADEPEIIERFSKRYDYSENYKQLQHLDDTCCGYWCIAFIHWCTNYKGKLDEALIMFIDLFDEKEENNKRMLKLYLKSVL